MPFNAAHLSLSNTTLRIRCGYKQKDLMREVVLGECANAVVWNKADRVWVALWDLGAPDKFVIYRALKKAGVKAYVF